jgi:hypothetical protein
MLHDHELVARGLARWYQGRLIPVMRGGDHRDEPLFSLPPDDLTAIDDAELAELAAGLRERVREVYEGRRDPEIVGERSQSDVSTEMQAAVLAIEAIDAELGARTEQDEQFDSTTTELATRAGVSLSAQEGEGDGEGAGDAETAEEGDGAEGAGDAETTEEGDGGDGGGEAQTAAATRTRRSSGGGATARAPRPLPAARRHRPVHTDDDGRGLRVTSHAAGLGAPYSAMTPLDRGMLGEFLTDIVRRNRVQPGQKAVLAHASYTFPSDRILEDGPDSHLSNSIRIRNAINPETTSMEALTASGGLCAPLPAIYDLPGVETAARPVRAALPSFQAARGGVQLGATPIMGDYAAATDAVLASDNELGGTFATKSCMRIVCPDFTSVTVDSIYQCIEADNLAARAYPELMARIADLVNAEQARLADGRLLSAIKAGSTQVTYGDVSPGALYHFLAAVYQLAAGIRSRHRMEEGRTLQAFLPAWIIDLLALDISRGVVADRFQTRAQIDTILRNAGIIPTYYLDGPSTGTGQVFGAQTAGAMLEFPDVVQWAIFPTGTWLHLDAGELQLGVVRDSTLNSTNDFQVFSETWENIGLVGVESIWASTTVCPNGEVAAAAAAETCAT